MVEDERVERHDFAMRVKDIESELARDEAGHRHDHSKASLHGSVSVERLACSK